MEAHRTTTPPEVLTEVIADHSDSETGNYGDVDQVVDVSRLLMAETGAYYTLNSLNFFSFSFLL